MVSFTFFCLSGRNGVEIVLNEEHIVLNFLLWTKGDFSSLARVGLCAGGNQWLLEMKKTAGVLFFFYSFFPSNPPTSKGIMLLIETKRVVISSDKEAQG